VVLPDETIFRGRIKLAEFRPLSEILALTSGIWNLTTSKSTCSGRDTPGRGPTADVDRSLVRTPTLVSAAWETDGCANIILAANFMVGRSAWYVKSWQSRLAEVSERSPFSRLSSPRFRRFWERPEISLDKSVSVRKLATSELMWLDRAKHPRRERAA
jgi:hypothetical protein